MGDSTGHDLVHVSRLLTIAWRSVELVVAGKGRWRVSSLFQWIDSFVNKAVKNYTLWIAVGVGVVIAIGFKVWFFLFPAVLEPPVYASFIRLQSQWSESQRERYYQTSQGSLVVPYAWFRALEWRTGTQMFASPEVQTQFGLLPDNDRTYNPDQLPIGIVKEIVPDPYVNTLGQGQKEWASLSCAACHTGQLLYKGTALRIDGGEGLWRFEQWSQDFLYSLVFTASSPDKFRRFCARINGYWPSGQCSEPELKTLQKQLKVYFDSDLVINAVNAVINHTYPNQEGFTRTDALGRGVNGEFGSLNPSNIDSSTGPVSYPPLWFTHDFDWVQSPAAIRQPLGRNVTEAWGVNVMVELKDPAKRFGSTAELDNMFWMESLLSVLRPPKWPENILGRIDPERVKRGSYLFNQAIWSQALPASEAELAPDPQGFIKGPNPNRPTTGYCARCHAPALDPQPDKYGHRYVQLPLYRMDVMGTDPQDAMLFRKRVVKTGPLAPLFDNQKQVGIGTALTVSVTGIIDKWFNDHNISGPCRVVMEGYRDNLFRAPPAYPARPLDGYWSTGPFLHNGSIRTLFQLLSPIENRERKFWKGSWEFDPFEVGFRNEKLKGGFLFDTTLKGNSNEGHEFRNAPPNTPGVIGPYLTPEQRLDIIEYLKTLDSVEAILASQDEREAILDASAPFYEEDTSKTPVGAPESAGGFKKADYCDSLVSAETDVGMKPK